MGVFLSIVTDSMKKGLVQTDKTTELYQRLRRDKARKRESKDAGHKRPLWKSDWSK